MPAWTNFLYWLPFWIDYTDNFDKPWDHNKHNCKGCNHCEYASECDVSEDINLKILGENLIDHAALLCKYLTISCILVEFAPLNNMQSPLSSSSNMLACALL